MFDKGNDKTNKNPRNRGQIFIETRTERRLWLDCQSRRHAIQWARLVSWLRYESARLPLENDSWENDRTNFGQSWSLWRQLKVWYGVWWRQGGRHGQNLSQKWVQFRRQRLAYEWHHWWALACLRLLRSNFLLALKAYGLGQNACESARPVHGTYKTTDRGSIPRWRVKSGRDGKGLHDRLWSSIAHSRTSHVFVRCFSRLCLQQVWVHWLQGILQLLHNWLRGKLVKWGLSRRHYVLRQNALCLQVAAARATGYEHQDLNLTEKRLIE